MIEAAMYVALGFCTAGLIGLAILPAFYRRAARLTEEALRAVNPSSYAEVRAAQDQARARHAVELRRVERQLESEREKASKHHLEATRMKREVEALERSLQEKADEMKARQASIESDEKAADLLSEEVSTLKKKLSEAEKSLAESWTNSAEDKPSSESEESPKDESGWMPASDTMALATITGLEAEVATLKAKLSKYEPTVAGEVQAERDEAARSRLAELEAQLVDTESKYISAQAEVTRLSLVLESSGSAENEMNADLKEQLNRISNESSERLAKLENKERQLARLTGQVKRLQNDLAGAPALNDLRKEFRKLADRVATADKVLVTKKSAQAAPAPAVSKAEEETGLAAKPKRRVKRSANGASGTEKRSAKRTTPETETPAKSADIASAAEALVSRIVASNRGAQPKKSGEPDAVVANQLSEDSAPQETKPAKQKKKDVA
ncbi:hypothetical protein FIV00_06555 [Labrenzia sp. THAF82]|uniref:hypothetical protein n=1 Tax=Labrenzia sp. THAF82 TaxID=2587861 RepID=UPI0012A96C7F|nr:hypothetical protein [Labrenzia sp. THAF82]QFT30123.1 hypothetical protein FIV00_06555 [Labrenzia sp. THAF82]